MKLSVVAIGRLKGPESDLATRYRERAAGLGRGLGFAGFDMAELGESRAATADQRKTDEAAALLGRARPARIVALDERDAPCSSETFAARLAAFRDDGTGAVAFVIGGADGLAPRLRDEADWTISFGAMTLPHQIVRVLVLEQLYRAMTILSGHPYHRA